MSQVFIIARWGKTHDVFRMGTNTDSTSLTGSWCLRHD